MNIIAGKYKRRKLNYPNDRSFRPTKSMVREAVFSKIGFSIEGASFLDLCAGSGAMGLEAASRGAEKVVCVDKDIQYLKKNVTVLNANIDVVRMDVIRYLKTVKQGLFDFIYFDPVWADHDIYASGLDIIFERQLVTEGGMIMVEHDRFMIFTDDYLNQRLSVKKYGQSYLSIWLV